MVASFMDKAVTKSYIRLPGSGSDKGARVSFCDLSLGSNLAASIPVPQHVETPRSVSVTAKISTSPVTDTTQNKRPRPEDENVETNESKIPRMDNTNQNDGPIDLTFKPATVSTSPVTASPQEISIIEPAAAIINNEPVSDIQNPCNPITIDNTEHVTKLKEENNKLRSENAILQKQLSLFKQLIRNPQRLESVLQRLNERALIKPTGAALPA